MMIHLKFAPLLLVAGLFLTLAGTGVSRGQPSASKRVLILFEGSDNPSNYGRGDARQLAMLLGHFNVDYKLEGLEAYASGDIEKYDLSFFIGYSAAYEPPDRFLRDVYSTRYPAFSMLVPDQVRADEFLKEFREFEKNGDLPRLVVLLLPADHTSGTAPGFPTPRAMVADNDLALGRVVEAISHSRYWKASAIFVTEDDAQNGLDHVDGHRTIGLVISPWARRGAVDNTFHTAINVFRTIEQILGLPPTNQFDLAAEPMFSVFTSEPDDSTYKALPNRIPLDEMNPALRGLRGAQERLARSSLEMDFSEPDAAPEVLLNRAIWHSVKGYGTPYPEKRR